jgi:glycogen(starch) synthase
VRLLAIGNMYPPHHLGGYELVWKGATDHLRARAADVRVLTTDMRLPGVAEPDDPWVHRDLRWYWRDHAWPRMSPRAVLALERHNHSVLARHLAEHRPEAVLWWSMGGMSLSLVAAARGARLPGAAFVHDEWPRYAPQRDRWIAAARRHPAVRRALWHLTRIPTWFDAAEIDRWLFVSEFTHRACEGSNGVLPAWRIAPSGIDEAFLDPRPEQPWGWRLLYVGRIDPRKGVDTAVAALDSLPDEATLTIVGGGEEPPPESERVRVLGPQGVDELRERYAEADAVLFPVIWEEPWGLVPLEAMGMGRPVVATGRGGSAEYLRDGENAVLFQAGDPAALAAAVRRLAEDPALRARLRDGGLATAPEHTRARFHAEVERAVCAILGRGDYFGEMAAQH